MYQMNVNFKGFSKLVLSISFDSNALKRPEPLSESYTENTKKSGNFCKFRIPAFFEPVSAARSLLETSVIAPVLVIIQHEAFLTLLLVTGLQLIEQYN